MYIEELELSGLRNLSHTRLSPGPLLNVVYGANASGKTSLLEAVYLLGTARSFRNNRPQELIQHGQSALRVAGRIRGGDGRTFWVGVQRSAAETRIRLEARTVQSASELAQRVPMLVIAPEVHDLIEGGPGVRRRLLDWGLFHVEHSYLALWQDYYRVLRQRNVMLRRGSVDAQVQAWDSQLVVAGERLHEVRSRYVNRLAEFLAADLDAFTGGATGMRYFPGWESGREYAEVLKERLEADRERGYTGPGPHRADLVLTVSGQALRGKLSRGQSKLFMGALRVGQARLLRAETGKIPLILVDDFAAELDPHGRQRFLDVIRAVGGQVFLTVTERALAPDSVSGPAVVFHVEHGVVEKVV